MATLDGCDAIVRNKLAVIIRLFTILHEAVRYSKAVALIKWHEVIEE